MPQCPQCKNEVPVGARRCSHCNKLLLDEKKQSLFNEIKRKVDKTIDKAESRTKRAEERFFREFAYVKYILVVIGVPLGIVLGFLGYSTITDYQERLDRLETQYKEAARDLDAKYKDDVRKMAAEETDGAIRGIVTEKLDPVLQNYNTVMLALAGNRTAFEKLSQLQTSGDDNIRQLAKTTRENIIQQGLIEPTDCALILLTGRQKIDLRECTPEELIRLLNSPDQGVRYVVARYLFLRHKDEDREKVKSKYVPAYIDRLCNKESREEALQICAAISHSLKTLTGQSFGIGELDRWCEWYEKHRDEFSSPK